MAKVVVDHIAGEPVMHEHKATHLTSEPNVNDLQDGEERTVALSGTFYIYRRIGAALYRVAMNVVAAVINYRITEAGDSRITESGDVRITE